MTKFSVLPTSLLEKLFDLALVGACSDEHNQVCSEVALILDEKPSEVPYDEEIYQDFYRYGPLLDLKNMSRDEQGGFVDPQTAKAFEQYVHAMVRHEPGHLAVKDKASGFFRAMGEVSATLKPKAETTEAFERAFDLLTRLDPAMPLSQVMVWLREFLSGSQDAVVALSAAEGEWVSVEDGLPPESSIMLVTNTAWPHSIQRGEPAPMKVGYLELGQWKLFGASWKPTHWRLPPPPAVEIKALQAAGAVH